MAVNKASFVKGILKIVLVILFGSILVSGFIWLRRHDANTIQQANVGDRRIFALAMNAKDRKAIEESSGSERGIKIKVWADQVKRAGAYEDAKNYEMAEIEYKKAIQLAPEKIDEWESRSGLARIYEATGQYELAIEQLDWLIKGKPRKDVIDKLLSRKQTLEKLLAEQTNANS